MVPKCPAPKCPAPKRHGAELSSAESAAAPKWPSPINITCYASGVRYIRIKSYAYLCTSGIYQIWKNNFPEISHIFPQDISYPLILGDFFYILQKIKVGEWNKILSPIHPFPSVLSYWKKTFIKNNRYKT